MRLFLPEKRTHQGKNTKRSLRPSRQLGPPVQRTSWFGEEPSGSESEPPAQRGQGYIEVIIGLAIILILFHAFASLIITAYDLLGNSRTRVTARYLTTERIEEIHNLPYTQVGVAGGIPPGSLPQLETRNRNGLTYTIRTSVVFIDDSFDQTAPNDPFPADYKRVRVDVSWTGRFVAGESVTMITDIASSTTTSGGTLSVLVFDANALPVPQADVRITNTQANPPIDLQLKTDDLGRIVLPGAPPCNTCYEITATKAGYSTDRTYTTAEVANPAKPPASVIEGDLTEISFAIDRTAAVTVLSTRDRDYDYAALPNKSFTLQGGKTIGADSLGKPVYKYKEDLQTDAAGQLTLSDMEWDSYTLSLATGSWALTGTNPLRPVIVLPNQTLDLLFASASSTSNSLLLAVTDASGSAIASASAHLTGPGGYDKTIFSGETSVPDFGQAFFGSLSATTYTLDATKEGFMPKSDSIPVSGQTERTIQLDPL